MTQPSNLGQHGSQELLDGLKKVFPLSRPSLTDTERRIFLRSGHQEVIEFLENQFNERFAQALEP